MWANSLAHRAAKKAGYLTTMEQWHQTAKGKYKDRLQMSLFLRGLAKGGHVKDAAEKLHATPYATIEKIDPYHRQTIVFLDRDVTNASDAHDASDNKMGEAFLDYLNDYRFRARPIRTRVSTMASVFRILHRHAGRSWRRQVHEPADSLLRRT